MDESKQCDGAGRGLTVCYVANMFITREGFTATCVLALKPLVTYSFFTHGHNTGVTAAVQGGDSGLEQLDKVQDGRLVVNEAWPSSGNWPAG